MICPTCSKPLIKREFSALRFHLNGEGLHSYECINYAHSRVDLYNFTLKPLYYRFSLFDKIITGDKNSKTFLYEANNHDPIIRIKYICINTNNLYEEVHNLFNKLMKLKAFA